MEFIELWHSGEVAVVPDRAAPGQGGNPAERPRKSKATVFAA